MLRRHSHSASCTRMEQRMSDTVSVAIVVGISTLAATGITQYFQGRREKRSQRDAKSERVRGAYRVAMKGADTIMMAAWEAGNALFPGETMDEREVRLYRDFRTGADMLNQAGTELILENVSSNLHE